MGVKGFCTNPADQRMEIYRLYSELNIRNKPGELHYSGDWGKRIVSQSKTCLDNIFEFKANLGNIVRTCLKMDKNPSLLPGPLAGERVEAFGKAVLF